jgi:hypothetical protein
MISEVEFATNYTSVWRLLTPNSESVIKRINQSVLTLSRRGTVWSRPERRAFINEIAFHMFALSLSGVDGAATRYSELMPLAIAEARRKQELYADSRSLDIAEPSLLEMTEAYMLYRRLRSFRFRVYPPGGPIHLAPEFKGCGILDKCEADLIVGDLLIEVKAGDRNFRSTDLRQLLTYCALNYVENGYQIRRIALLNPRRAIYFTTELETLCLQLAAKSPSELLSDIVYFLSSGDLSR